MSKVIVTTCDIDEPYEIIGPVFYQISNKSYKKFQQKTEEYKEKIEKNKSLGIHDNSKLGAGEFIMMLAGEWSAGQNKFNDAFFIAVEELKLIGERLGADAIIGMRQDIDIDTNGFAYFYLQMYGTAVRFLDDSDELPDL